MKLVQIWTSQVALFVDWADPRGIVFTFHLTKLAIHPQSQPSMVSPPRCISVVSPLTHLVGTHKPARCGVYTSPRAYTGHLAETANTTHPLPLPLCMHPSSLPPPPYTKHLDEYFCFPFFFHLILNWGRISAATTLPLSPRAHAGHLRSPAARLLLARHRIDPVAYAIHRPCHAQLPPPHCRTNQHHCRYRPSHRHVIKTDRKSEPSRPLRLTN